MKMGSFSEGRRNSNALPSSSCLAVLPTRYRYLQDSLVVPPMQCTAGSMGCNVCTKQNSSFVFEKKKKRFPSSFVSHRESWVEYQGNVIEVLHRSNLLAAWRENNWFYRVHAWLFNWVDVRNPLRLEDFTNAFFHKGRRNYNALPSSVSGMEFLVTWP